MNKIRAAAQSDMGVATTRTTVPLLWVTAIVTVASWLGINIDSQAIVDAGPVLVLGYGLLYRILREVEGRYPAVGRIVFGSSVEPTY